jgi:chromosome segregation ATPase
MALDTLAAELREAEKLIEKLTQSRNRLFTRAEAAATENGELRLEVEAQIALREIAEDDLRGAMIIEQAHVDVCSELADLRAKCAAMEEVVKSAEHSITITFGHQDYYDGTIWRPCGCRLCNALREYRNPTKLPPGTPDPRD